MKKGLHPYMNKAYVLDFNNNLHMVNTSTNSKFLKSVVHAKKYNNITKKSFNLWGRLKYNRHTNEVNHKNKYQVNKNLKKTHKSLGRKTKAFKRKSKLKSLLNNLRYYVKQ